MKSEESEEAEEKIRSAVAGVRPYRLDTHTLKTKRLKFRLHDEEFEEIRETAESLGLSIAEYFCALHRYAVRELHPNPEGGEWVHPAPRRRGSRELPRE